jgi:hypothetical protein
LALVGDFLTSVAGFYHRAWRGHLYAQVAGLPFCMVIGRGLTSALHAFAVRSVQRFTVTGV